MLVISRKQGEQILIGDNIIIHVLLSQGNRVRLGIEAPANVTIRREELCDALQKGTDPQC